MNIQYRKEGDYFIPDWEIPESQKKPLGYLGLEAIHIRL